MATVNKEAVLKAKAGISKGQIMARGPDNVPAMVTDQSGTPQAPAAIKEGEIIFSVESVIGAGKGDYDAGAEFLMSLQEKLRELGLKYLEKNSLAGAPIE